MNTIIGNKTTNGWDKVRVGDSLRLINGRAFKPSEWKVSGLPIVRIQNLNNAEAPFNHYEGNLPEKFLLNNGDLLFAWSGTPGTSFGAHIWRGGKAWLNQHIFKVMFDEAEFNKKFLQLAINQNLNEYIGAAHGGAGLAHITKGRFEQSELIKPTLDEQSAIVAEIEKQFSRLDEAVVSLKRVKANFKRYKAAVLKAAVEGKLTEEWRKQHPGIEPASKLLERILAEPRAKETLKDYEPLDASLLKQLPKGWSWARVEDIGHVQLGRQRAPKYHSGENMRPYLRVQNVFEDRIDLDDVKEMDFSQDDYKRFKLELGDILLNEGQSPELLGRPAIYRGELPGACFTNTLIRFKAYAPVTPEYPLIVFRAYMRTGRFTREGTITTNIAHLSAGRFAKIEFPVPPLKEQQEIVAEVERRLSVIEELEAAVDANLKRAASLRQAILTRAFAGKLVSPALKKTPDVSSDFSIAAESPSTYRTAR